jgi:radical SAM protein with 4Fe4S-binding SPASM domain
MVGITRLLCDIRSASDPIRYTGPPAEKRRPIVVWNMTRKCNLFCLHCYIDAKEEADANELTTEEGRVLIDDLADFKVPALLFSGGEPLVRPDIYELGAYAYERGIRPVLSTNGTLITPSVAQKLKDHNYKYIGVSIDGLEPVNDKFRGMRGGFEAALQGIRNCLAIDLKAGVRFTINKHNYNDLEGILDIVYEEKIPRACVYHLAYAGRGRRIAGDDLAHEETRQAMDLIFDKAVELHERGSKVEMHTVDNYTDAAYLWLRVARDEPERAQEVWDLLKHNGGDGSGMRVADIDPLGFVHADQFWQHYSFGNVRERPFSEIWTDVTNPMMAGLKDRKDLLTGRCAKTNCRFQEICNGNLRVRAEAAYDDVWAEDPACYLTDEEIAIDQPGPHQLAPVAA